MKDKEDFDGDILRGLEGGWDFRVDWRARLVKKWRAQHRGMYETMAGERDPFLRQYFRLKAEGKCAAEAAFRWAERTHQTRKNSIAAAIVKAMAVAGCDKEEIAERLQTTRLAVVIFLRLFFDILRYRGNLAWLASIALPEILANDPNPIVQKEKVLLAAAFSGGAARLRKVMTGRIPEGEELARLRGEILAIIASKAYQFLLSCGAPSAADAERFLEIARLPRTADIDAEQQANRKALMKFVQNFTRPPAAVELPPRLELSETSAESQPSFSNS